MFQKRFWVKSAIYVAPVAIVSFVFASLVNVDDYFFDNPDELREMELNQMAYQESLLDMSNPWNRININDPASFLMSLFVGADAEILKKLKQVIAELGQDKLLFLTDILRMVELSDAQRDRFVVLISTMLKSDAGLEKLPVLVDLLKSLEEAEKEALQQKATGEVQVVQAEAVEPNVLLQPEFTSEEEINLSLVDLLTTDKPEALNFLLDSMLMLSPSEYQKLVSLMTSLGVIRTEKLLTLLDNLSLSNVKKLVVILSTLDASTLRSVVDRLDVIPLSLVDDLIQFASRLSNKEIKQLFTVTASFSQSNFKTFVNLHEEMSLPTIKASFSIYSQLNDSDVKSLSINILDNYVGKTTDLKLIVETLGGFSSGTVKTFISNFEYLSNEAFKDLPFIFRKLNSNNDKERLVEEASFISLNNRERALEVFRTIQSDSVAKVLDISTNLSGSSSKTKLFEQAYRIHDFSPGESDNSGRIISGYTPRTTVHNSNTKVVLEGLVDQLYSINDKNLNTDLLDLSDDLSDVSLYRGAEVVTDIDIQATDLSKPSAGFSKPGEGVTLSKAKRRGTRVHRLVQIQRQLTRNERASAIDTLHDIDTRKHRKAAIDLGFYADTALLKDSIGYSEQLRHRLGYEDGLEANKRLVVVASRVDNDAMNEYNSTRASEEEYYSTLNKARQAGLDALQNEREDRVGKILKQTTKDIDPYGYKKTFESGKNVMKIVSLYRRLDTMEPKESRFHRTRAAELADALASSEGLILGPNGPAGVSREVTQETKLRRIDEYLDLPYDILWERRVISLTDRPLIVPHITEHQFGVPDPEKVKKDQRNSKPKVILVRPKSTSSLQN